VTAETLNALSPPRPLNVREPVITGAVFETTSGVRQPVAGALIDVDTGMVDRATTLTDLNGAYFLCGLPQPAVEIGVWKDGYATKYVWPVDTTQSATLDIELQRQ
jgi:hypothetical protein